jgi:hypothetical protein
MTWRSQTSGPGMHRSRVANARKENLAAVVAARKLVGQAMGS